MLYELFRLPLILLFFSYYRRIYWVGAQKVPKDKPIVIISNHSTAFVEQILVAAFLRRGIYFWARSSVFPNSPLIKSLMHSVHMLPIKRGEEGMKDSRENDGTFQASFQHLLEGKALYVAPEGNCVMEKRLRPFRTGTARVALGAYSAGDYKTPIYIVPVGVNYTHHRAFRSDVMVSFGEALNLADFEEEQRKDPQRAARLLTNRMREMLLKEVIQINEVADEGLTEQLFELYRNDTVSPIGPRFSADNSRLRMEQSLASMVNRLAVEEKTALSTQSAEYFGTLAKNKLSDAMFSDLQRLGFGGKSLLFVGAMPAFIGWLSGYLPLALAKHYRDKMMTSEKMMQFHAPLAMVFSLVTWIAYSLLIIAISAWWLSWWSIGLPPTMALLQYWQICYRDYFDTWQKARRFKRFSHINKELTQQLGAMRRALKQKADSLLHI